MNLSFDEIMAILHDHHKDLAAFGDLHPSSLPQGEGTFKLLMAEDPR